MAIKHPIPVDVLRQLIRLDPATGKLWWLPRDPKWFNDTAQTREHNAAIWNGRYAGTEAFTAPNKGYRCGRIFDRLYQANRVAFALTNGRWPTGVAEHWDGVPSNNRPGNLRDASQQQNCRNQKPKGGTSRYKGVSWAAHRGYWIVTARDARGKQRYIGRFTDEVAAARAYDDFARREHGEFGRLNF